MFPNACQGLLLSGVWASRGARRCEIMAGAGNWPSCGRAAGVSPNAVGGCEQSCLLGTRSSSRSACVLPHQVPACHVTCLLASCHAIPSRVMSGLCYVTHGVICRMMLRYVISSRVASRYVRPCVTSSLVTPQVMSCHRLPLCRVVPCHVRSSLFHLLSPLLMSCHAMLRHLPCVMPSHVMSSCHLMSCHGMRCHVMSCFTRLSRHVLAQAP